MGSDVVKTSIVLLRITRTAHNTDVGIVDTRRDHGFTDRFTHITAVPTARTCALIGIHHTVWHGHDGKVRRGIIGHHQFRGRDFLEIIRRKRRQVLDHGVAIPRWH
ncbi:Uncharacterised protein [Vibrio cholerae]|nr:Uncharacterised protein [Vibrio cholerae]